MKINKKLRYGSLSVIITAVTVAIVVFINIIVDTLLARFDVKLDLSENKLYSIESSTEEYLKNLDDEIEFIFGSPEGNFTSSTEFNQVNEIAKKFSASGKVKLDYIDLLTNPALSGEYGGEMTSSSIVVQSKNTGRYKVLAQLDYLEVVYYNQNGEVIDYDQAYFLASYGMSVYQDVSSAAEQAFLSAIMQVSASDPVRVAFTTGFGENEKLSSESLVTLLENNIYEIETIDLNLTNEISDEIDYLVIFYPSYDYTADVIRKVEAWLDNKANYGKNLFYIPSLDVIETPVLDGFLEEWGLRVEKGIVAQTDQSYCLAGDPYVQKIALSESNYTGALAGKQFTGMYIRPITQLFAERSSYTTIPLMTTFDGGVLRPFDSDADWTPNMDESGVMNVAMESSKMRYDGSTPLVSRLFVFGNPYNFTSSTLDVAQYANAEFYINIFNALSGREKGVVIKSKSYQMTTFRITAEQSQTIAIVFCVVLPLITIGLGIFVYIRRRFR